MEGILKDSIYEEEAVNILDEKYYRLKICLIGLHVEVSAKINKNGINGIKLNNVPKGYLADSKKLYGSLRFDCRSRYTSQKRICNSEQYLPILW